VKIGAFPAEAAFLPALAKRWLDSGEDSSDGLLILPSRRAAQALAGAFLAQHDGKALLLPRIIALGAIDEAGLSLAGALDLPPAIAPMRRQAMLARLILRLNGANGAPQKLHAAWALAADLATLLDEADYAEVDLARTLPEVVAAELAVHWQTTLEFLKIITHHWPDILAGMGCINPAARQVALIDAQNAAWRDSPPAQRVWMVAAEGNPAVCRLARTVAGLPEGFLLLPGCDAALPEQAWEALEDGHAQAGIARLLGAIGARRDEILRLPAPASNVPERRSFLFSRALLPAAALGDWQLPAALETTGVSRLEAPDEAQNATAIAMILRATLEVPGRTAALITPDRGLATRVAAALKRFGITADDSAGEPLEQTAPAVLLRLLARAAGGQFAPLPLLALLKHPLTAAGLAPERCREQARRLEVLALRGPRPSPGFDGIKFRLDAEKHGAELVFLERLELLLRPLAMPLSIAPADALRALLEGAENICASEEQSGAVRLWAGEAGLALSELFFEALSALEDLPDIAPADLADLLDGLLAGAVVRRPRTKDGHPRIAIWGVQEAALQSVDVAVLGGLVEGVWPAAAEPGPWLSRPMRQAAGLPPGEQKIGQAAHDFFALAASCGEIVLAAPARRERAPAVPARWLTRLEALLAGSGKTLRRHDAASWAAQLDLPLRRETREKPAPRPPAELRPRSLSISDFATLMADPYAIYARRILKIRQLDRLDAETDAQFFGDVVHAGLAKFFMDAGNFEQAEALAKLKAAMEAVMREQRPRAALEHWWAARLERIAEWIFEVEQTRRTERGMPAAVALETQARLAIDGGFELVGRADRIERASDGGVSIFDYKTGTPPPAKAVSEGSAPQLPLEAVMAEAGAFGDDFMDGVTELAYVKLSGRFEAGKLQVLFSKKPDALRQVIDGAGAALPEIFTKFARAETAYLASPHPKRENKYDVYAGISRRGEWAGDDVGEDAELGDD
jgi:ATP-dependent helicase/nuclease subunit B